jgi:adenine-specific DNA-methyltransferase
MRWSFSPENDVTLSREHDLVVDPFAGVGPALVAAIRHRRRSAGAEIMPQYCEVARERIVLESQGLLRTRPMGRALYEPTGREQVARPGDRQSNGALSSSASTASSPTTYS